MKKPNTNEQRERQTGQYEIALDKICTCGHRAGLHLADGTRAERSCTIANCSCEGIHIVKRKNPTSTRTATRSEVRSPTSTKTSTKATTTGNRTSTSTDGSYNTTTNNYGSKRGKNPAPAMYIITAKGSGPKMHYDGVKFSQRAKVKLFASPRTANKFAIRLLQKYPVLRGYRVAIEDNRHRVSSSK